MDAIRLLGPLELSWRGSTHPLGSLREQKVLAALLLECGRPVSADALIAQVWDDDAPEQARETLISYLSRARRRLARATGDAVQIRAHAGTYTVVVADHEDVIDLFRFRRLRRQAVSIAESGDGDKALTLFAAAEAECGAEPLAGLSGSWTQRIRLGLAEEIRAARLERIEVELRLGRHADVIGELHRLLARHPEDERLVGHLMVALYRCDRQADALRVYQETRRLLRDSYGSEPGSRLRDLHQKILRQDLDLAVTPMYRRTGRADQPRTLPPPPDGFTGRAAELAVLTGRPGPGTTVDVIAGMPGVGKSALASYAAHQLSRQYPDAQLYLNLREHEPGGSPLSPSAALAELLRMLDVPPTRLPDALPRRAELWQREIAHRRLVVVLDDVTDPAQIAPILPRGQGSRVLVTTRRRLRSLTGVRRVNLDVLTSEEARTLFVRTAGQPEDDPVAAQIVARLGNLPLAIKLAAASLRDTYANDAAALMADLVSSGPGDDEWHTDSALNAAFELSYQQLTERQRRLLRQIAASPCPRITERSAAVLTEVPAEEVRADLEALVEHHLLSGEARDGYALHDLTRLFARDRGVREGRTGEHRRGIERLASYYLDVTREADRALHPHRRRTKNPGKADSSPPASEAAYRELLAGEWRNILTVAQHTVRQEGKRKGADLAIAISTYLETSGLWEECASCVRMALTAYRSLDEPRGVAQAMFELGHVLFRTGHHGAALDNFREAGSLFRSLADRGAEAETLDWMGIVHWSNGRIREALAHHQEAHVIYLGVGDVRGEAEALGHSGIAYCHLGRYPEAVESFTASLAIFRRIGDLRGEAMTLNNLGEVHRRRGLHRDAVDRYREAMAIYETITGRQALAIVQNNLGRIEHYKGNHREALRRYRHALSTFRDTGDRRNIASALNSIGATYRELEMHSEAIIHHTEAKEIAESLGELYELTRALAGIGDAEGGLGRHASALANYERALRLAQEMGDPLQQARIHDGIGSVVLDTSGPDAARIHWRQALDLFEGIGAPEAAILALRLRTAGSRTNPRES
ncbi:AfsR/SARP family transcriptional regulator [Actinocorallia sp. A-T 12471]|uniref:AfsR/SARP family transcriptional regulator n=1 Tax=Actinocorallia sp. A-T 12471 TaxID=3089813 RepID=UPI0029CC7BD2|nr:tetratricopeptide repeat protein [Actinocorallia sp. A-T 12471]MDX6740587.1 tetratricopeptide repeat protein [Actinocorallia sp. A-T 12471]